MPRRVGSHQTRRRLHVVVGGWVPTAEPGPAVVFDRLALHHAWRASVLVERLPVLRELPREDLLVAPPGFEALLDHLAANTADDCQVVVSTWARPREPEGWHVVEVGV